MTWKKFSLLTEARKEFPESPCIYIQADDKAKPLRIGKASKGLNVRYRGGTGYAIDAAMYGSKNTIFVAGVPENICDAVEAELIWRGRNELPYNNIGRKRPPDKRFQLVHTGNVPDFSRFDK